MTEIERVFWDRILGRGVDGARKVWRLLRGEGIDVARCTVERSMRQRGFAAFGAASSSSPPGSITPPTAREIMCSAVSVPIDKIVNQPRRKVPEGRPEFVELSPAVRRKREAILAFDRGGASIGPGEAINRRLEHLRGIAPASATSPTTSHVAWSTPAKSWHASTHSKSGRSLPATGQQSKWGRSR